MSTEIGTVTVSFLGVCTIFLDLPSQVPPGTEPPPPNRVVLAKATKEFIKQTGVYPHMARMQLVADEIIFDGPPPPRSVTSDPNTFHLGGAHLRIANARETTLSIQLGCLPSLQAHLDGPLSPPAESVYLPDPAFVQAWFDVSRGTSWNAFLMSTNPPCNLIPSISILTVQTDGAPVLEYNLFGLAGSPTLITLLGEAPNINVMNFACGEALVDDDEDFLLNYQLAATVPPQTAISVPASNVCSIPSSSVGMVYGVNGCGDAGPGCSNTTYP